MDSSAWLELEAASIIGIELYVFAAGGQFQLLIPAGRYNQRNSQGLYTYH